MRQKVINSLLAGALGDAWGAPYEGRVGPLRFEVPERLAVTDDTQLTLATCEAILDAGRVDPGVIAEHFRRWYQEGRIQGMGSSTLKAMRDLASGTHWALAGAGAAMRIAPLAFLLDPDNATDRQLIRDVCRITHHNDEAYAGALAVVYALRGSVAQLPDTAVRDRIEQIRGMAPAEAARAFGCSGHVVPLALLCAAQEMPLTETLSRAVSLGGDTDTIASIAGQVAGRDAADVPVFDSEIAALVKRFADFAGC